MAETAKRQETVKRQETIMRQETAKRRETDQRTERIWTLVLCLAIVVSVVLMWSLCADEGIDYDESYSFKSARDFNLAQIVRKMIDDRDTDVPFYYCALRVWILAFGNIGHRFLAARLFSVAGTLASMLLGMTAVRRLWGNLTALYFMIATALAPAMLHVSVNIRMYSWTNFLVTAGAVLAFCIVQDPGRKRLWALLYGVTVTALFSHYFTAFAFLAIYLYLLAALWIYERKSLWKGFVCGVLAVLPLLGWIVVSGFFRFVKTDVEKVSVKPFSLSGLLEYLFATDMRFWLLVGVTPILIALAGGFFFMKKRQYRGEKGFALTCVSGIYLIYALALFVSSFAAHFFTPRHIMHATGMMWLGVAILLPRISRRVYLSGLAALVSMCYVNYRGEYELAYRDTPYLEDTKAFIADEMQPGDIVIFTADGMYSTLYSCYMPEQTFVKMGEIKDLNDLAGKRVWFFLTDWQKFFTGEQMETYHIRSENMGHYGFQIMDNCTDFDLLRLEIGGSR